MANIRDIRDAIATRLGMANLPNSQVYTHMPPTLDIPSGGCSLVVEPISGEHELTFGKPDMTHLFFELHLYVSVAGGSDNAEATIDKYLSNSGPHSVLQAINDDPTLQQSVIYARLRGWRDYGVIGVDNPRVSGPIFNAEMLSAVSDLEVDCLA